MFLSSSEQLLFCVLFCDLQLSRDPACALLWRAAGDEGLCQRTREPWHKPKAHVSRSIVTATPARTRPVQKREEKSGPMQKERERTKSRFTRTMTRFHRSPQVRRVLGHPWAIAKGGARYSQHPEPRVATHCFLMLI